MKGYRNILRRTVMQNSFCISMYPYPSSTFCYQSQPYGPPTYVPCVFCHSTIPSASMAAHLAQCPNALAAAPPTATSTPFGSTQSVQYRRVVRVERKTVNERDIQPIPIAPNPPVYVQETRRISAPWNQGIPEWAIEDGSTQSVSSQSSYYQKPLPPVPQQSQANRGAGMQRGAAGSPQAVNASRSQQQSTLMQTTREQGAQRMQQTQAVPMQRPQVIQSSAQQVIQRNTQIPGQVSAQPRPMNPRPVNQSNGNIQRLIKLPSKIESRCGITSPNSFVLQNLRSTSFPTHDCCLLRLILDTVWDHQQSQRRVISGIYIGLGIT